MSVCTHVPLTYSSVLGEKNNKTVKTLKTEVTGIESTVVIYEWILFLLALSWALNTLSKQLYH